MDYIGEIRSILSAPETVGMSHWDLICNLLSHEQDVEMVNEQIIPYLEGHFSRLEGSVRMWHEDIKHSPLQKLITHFEVQPYREGWFQTTRPFPDFQSYDPIHLKHMIVTLDPSGADAGWLPEGFFENKRLEVLEWSVGSPLPPDIQTDMLIVGSLTLDFRSPSLFRESLMSLKHKPKIIAIQHVYSNKYEGFLHKQWVEFALDNVVLIKRNDVQWSFLLPTAEDFRVMGATPYPIIGGEEPFESFLDLAARGVHLTYTSDDWSKEALFSWYTENKATILSLRR